MNDKRLIQGLLVGACLALLLGIIVTWVNIQPYKKAGKIQPSTTRQDDPEPETDTNAEAAADTPV